MPTVKSKKIAVKAKQKTIEPVVNEHNEVENAIKVFETLPTFSYLQNIGEAFNTHSYRLINHFRNVVLTVFMQDNSITKK